MQEEDTEDNITEEQIDIYTKELKDYSLLIQNIIVSDQGLIRGVTFGLSEEEIRGKELAKFAQSDAEMQFLVAGEFLADSVNVDIEYHFYLEEMTKIVLIIYTQGLEQQNEIFLDLHDFFCKKFLINKNLSDWNINNNMQLTIRKVGNQHEADIELIFRKL